MYRELGSLDSFGVHDGPYTGAPRTLRWADLPVTVRARLTRCLAREELPSPLLTGRLDSERRWAPLLVTALALGVTASFVVAQIPAWWWAIPLAGLGAAFGVGARLALHKEGLASGVYLFPLDIIEARDGQIRVTPLGSLRRAGIKRVGDQVLLALGFDHAGSNPSNAADFAFTCVDEAAAEQAYEKLHSAQKALERVTYGRDLEETTALDPLFAIRDTELWAGTTQRVHRSLWRPAVMGAAFGIFMYFTLFSIADHLAFRRAQRSYDEESYLAMGGRLHRAEARWNIEARQVHSFDHDTDETDKTAELAPLAELRHYPDSMLSVDELNARKARQIHAYQAYTSAVAARSIPHDIHFDTRLRQIFWSTSQHGDDRLYVRLRAAPDLERACADCAELATTVVGVFARVLAEVIPPSVVSVSNMRSDDDVSTHALVIDIEQSRRSPPNDPTHEGLRFVVSALSYGNDVGNAFTLDVPDPQTPLQALRDHSVFEEHYLLSIPGARTYDVARAYDRLYDELYGMFFPGDPRVPMRQPARTGEEPAGAHEELPNAARPE